jgi:hypothetical protein
MGPRMRRADADEGLAWLDVMRRRLGVLDGAVENPRRARAADAGAAARQRRRAGALGEIQQRALVGSPPRRLAGPGEGDDDGFFRISIPKASSAVTIANSPDVNMWLRETIERDGLPYSAFAVAMLCRAEPGAAL